jgi:DNA-binding NarL/FixJ family response regulator
MADLAGTAVVLADDHTIVREGFAALSEANGMRVVGQCSDGPSAVETILAKQPDFAIIDLHMPGMTGIEVARRLRSAGCPIKNMILSISREDKAVIETLRAGGQYVSPLLEGPGLFTKAKANGPDDAPPSLLPQQYHRIYG